MANKGKGVLIVLGLASIAGIIAAVTKGKPVEAAHSIALKAGTNNVIYTGPSQIAGVALQSIANYLGVVYYYDALGKLWIQVVYNTRLEPGMNLTIIIDRECIWTF